MRALSSLNLDLFSDLYYVVYHLVLICLVSECVHTEVSPEVNPPPRVVCPQETPSWLSRSSNATSCCPLESRGSPQTPARNLSSPSSLSQSSPSSCPHPSHKGSANEPPEPSDTFTSHLFLKLLPVSLKEPD